MIFIIQLLINVFIAKFPVIKCASSFSDAIFVTNHSETLALSHANRGIVLQKLGYYKQAYDDCECALNLNYPNHLKYKLMMRQAVCSLKLENISELESLLSKLSLIELNKGFTDDFCELKKQHNSLISKQMQSGVSKLELDDSGLTCEQNRSNQKM